MRQRESYAFQGTSFITDPINTSSASVTPANSRLPSKEKSIKFENLTLIDEYPTIIQGKFPLRVYRSWDYYDDHSFYRYHFGLPKSLFPRPLLTIFEATPFWGERYWIESDSFYIWWLPVSSKPNDDIPYPKLNKELKRIINAYNQVLRFIECKRGFAKR